MGIAWLLFRRTFALRPKRTSLFLLGYALATAVMITLLSVGEAVLLQAQDKDLLGGGDLILVPQGIDVESMKMGGLSALYYSIPQARFILRQLLGSSRFTQEIATISPYITSRLLYAAKPGSPKVESLFAMGSIPEQEKQLKNQALPWKNNKEDEEWLRPSMPDFYHEIDRFHLPSPDTKNLDRWAEWHYFNFEGAEFHGYLSFMVAGDVKNDRANWIISLQLNGDEYNRYGAQLPARKSELPLTKIYYSIGESSVKFVEDHYQIHLDFIDQIPIRGEIRFYPQPNLYFPPSDIARDDGFESGYVIAALRGRYDGNLVVGKNTFDFGNAKGYHDHNWGIWRRIEWNWGHAQGDEYSIFFGEIFLAGKTRGLFLGVFDRHGFLTLFRPEKIEFSDYKKLPEGPLAPMKLQMQQQKLFTSFRLIGKAASAVVTEVENDQFFVQYKMNYRIELVIDGRKTEFTAGGNAETYLKKVKG